MCRHGQQHYNLAQAAFVGRPSMKLINVTGVRHDDDHLYVVFARSRNEKSDEDPRPGRKSALCVYPLSTIHRQFTKNIQHCFNGNGVQGLDFINIVQRCVPTVKYNFSFTTNLNTKKKNRTFSIQKINNASSFDCPYKWLLIIFCAACSVVGDGISIQAAI